MSTIVIESRPLCEDPKSISTHPWHKRLVLPGSFFRQVFFVVGLPPLFQGLRMFLSYKFISYKDVSLTNCPRLQIRNTSK